MATFEILQEDDAAAGWTFVVQVLAADGSLSKHDVHLSWPDYNLYSPDGSAEPSEVATAAIGFMLDRIPQAFSRSKVDVAVARRHADDADESIRGLIRQKW